MIRYLLILSLLSSTCYAQTAPKCDQVLQACDKALNDQIKLNSLQSAIIDSMEKRTTIIVEQNKELQISNDSWYHNPFVVGGMGISAGIILGTLITSKLK